MKAFSLTELNKPTKNDATQDKSAVLVDKLLDVHTFKVESLKDLVGNAPEENHFYFMWTLNSFNAFTFIPYTIKNVGAIDELTISTYSINRRIIDSLIRYLNAAKIGKLLLVISDSIKFRLPKIYDYLDALVGKRQDVQVIYAWNHSKIALAKVADQYLCLEGSGNFSENAQYEQYVMTNSRKIYEFRHRCITGING